jgi:hypothetical protein
MVQNPDHPFVQILPTVLSSKLPKFPRDLTFLLN